MTRSFTSPFSTMCQGLVYLMSWAPDIGKIRENRLLKAIILSQPFDDCNGPSVPKSSIIRRDKRCIHLPLVKTSRSVASRFE